MTYEFTSAITGDLYTVVADTLEEARDKFRVLLLQEDEEHYKEIKEANGILGFTVEVDND